MILYSGGITGGIIAATMDRLKDMDYEEKVDNYSEDGDVEDPTDLSDYSEDSLDDYEEFRKVLKKMTQAEKDAYKKMNKVSEYIELTVYRFVLFFSINH